MGEIKVNKIDIHIQRKDRNEPSSRIGPAMPSFLVQLREKLQKSLKSHLKRSGNNDVWKSATSLLGKDKGSSNALEVDLEKQLQVWKENPTWVDHSPEIKVTVPKGSLCNLNVEVNVGLPPDAVYNIVTDPDNKRVFKNIKISSYEAPILENGCRVHVRCIWDIDTLGTRMPNVQHDMSISSLLFFARQCRDTCVLCLDTPQDTFEVISRRVLVDEGSRQVVELEQAALWRFLWWSGTISVHVLVDQNREDHTMKFKQVKTGFMKRFEGCWKVEPLLVDEKLCHPFIPETLADYVTCTGGKGRVGSKVSLEQIIQPALVPPPPISWYLRGITSKTTEMLISDLLVETARIRGDSDAKNSTGEIGVSDECPVDEILDIKQRWALRRKNAKRFHRSLPLLLN
ncbi:unnamed protein product [Camellia sinensis]